MLSLVVKKIEKSNFEFTIKHNYLLCARPWAKKSMDLNNINETPACPHDAHSPGEEAAISRQTDMKIKDPRQVSLGTANVQIQQPK